MKEHELDQILSGQEEIVPSAGFVRSVMEGVRREASTPAPIPFPWARALAGLVGSGAAMTAMCVIAFLRGAHVVYEESASPSWMKSLTDLGDWLSAANVGGLYWIMLSLLLTLASVKLSLRLTRG